MSRPRLPAWAEEMRSVFRSGTTSQFILHGAVFDLVPHSPVAGGVVSFLSLGQFLEQVMLAPYDVILTYDRSTGVQTKKGLKEFLAFLKSFDQWNGTQYATSPAAIPRQPAVALTVIDRFLDWAAQRPVIENNQLVTKPLRVAVLVEYAQFLAPRGDSLQVSGSHAEALIRLLDWANDPALVAGQALTILVAETLNDLHSALANNPHASKIHLALPTAPELHEFVTELCRQEPTIAAKLEVPADVLAQRSIGLSRINLRNALQLASKNDHTIDAAYLVRQRRELIEKECAGLLDFIESSYTLDSVAGLDEVKRWLREDATLIKTGRLRSVPMGYLFCGRIGTGKTFLTTCWSGEIGIPCVVMKNFRDKWQGSTEGNLEKIFEILRALGQVMVFVDEADQATGKRDGGSNDGGLGGRVYAMLAKEMSDTRNRGKIIWVFATSRPDLVEVDLKRQGRLDVHVPLFPPQDHVERKALLQNLAKKVGVAGEELPDLPETLEVGGNEMEALLVRASRVFDLQGGRAPEERRAFKDILAEVFADARPMAHAAHLEYMDLVAVKECTDGRFLPPRYKALTTDEIDARLEVLKHRLGW